MALLHLNHVKKSFVMKKNTLSFLPSSFKTKKAVDDVSFELDEGKVLVLAGESGSGKTTLAKLIIGSLTPDSGSIYFSDRDITSYKKNKEFFSLVQMIHQDPYSSINPYLKVKNIVMEPLNIHDKASNHAEKMEKVILALKRTKLEPVDDFLDKYPNMLSGGQRQRVSIARSIVKNPKLIIADEPVSMLDVSVRAEILSLLDDLRRNLNISIIYITHDLATSRYIGDKIGIMFAGKIIEFGDIDEVLSCPLHPYTWMLLDAIGFAGEDSKLYKNQVDMNAFDIPDRGCKFYNRCKLSSKECTNDLTEYGVFKRHTVSCFYYKNLNYN